MHYSVPRNSDAKKGGQGFWRRHFPDLCELLLGKDGTAPPSKDQKTVTKRKVGIVKKPARLLSSKKTVPPVGEIKALKPGLNDKKESDLKL
jgi:hypothetical protein